MNCMEVGGLFERHVVTPLSAEDHRALEAHLIGCDDCRAAWLGVLALRRERAREVPGPTPGAFDRILLRARRANARLDDRRSGRFWMGAAAGGALAASLLLAIFFFGRTFEPSSPAQGAELAIALHETRDMSIAIDSPVDVVQAEIRLVLVGGIALAGFEGQSELRWAAPLDRGVNLLTLPITMQARGGGHVLVEVSYGDAHKTFAVHVREGASAETIDSVVEEVRA